jgi:hypothetical protein
MMNKPAQKDIEYFQTIDSEILARAAKGEVDLNYLAKFELTQRGLNFDGRWIGFKESAKLLEASN